MARIIYTLGTVLVGLVSSFGELVGLVVLNIGTSLDHWTA